jgi:hypothetical protein
VRRASNLQQHNSKAAAPQTSNVQQLQLVCKVLRKKSFAADELQLHSRTSSSLNKRQKKQKRLEQQRLRIRESKPIGCAYSGNGCRSRSQN